MDCSPPGSSVHGISQARILEWVAISSSSIFLTQGSNLPLLLGRWILYHWVTWKALRERYVWCLVAQSCLTLWDPMDCSWSGSSVLGNSPQKNTGMGWHALLQGLFLTQEWNQGLPRCRRILYQVSHQGSPLNNKFGNHKDVQWSLYQWHYSQWTLVTVGTALLVLIACARCSRCSPGSFPLQHSHQRPETMPAWSVH